MRLTPRCALRCSFEHDAEAAEAVASSSGSPALDVVVVDLAQDAADVVTQLPVGIVGLERAEVGDPPAVVADAVVVGQRVVQRAPGDRLARLDRLDRLEQFESRPPPML